MLRIRSQSRRRRLVVRVANAFETAAESIDEFPSSFREDVDVDGLSLSTLRRRSLDARRWLFIGESHPAVDPFVDQLSERLLSDEIGSDVIVDARKPGTSIVGAWRQLEKQVKSGVPEIVVFFVGIHDAHFGSAHCEDFEFNLLKMIRQCHRLGSQVVIHTPPRHQLQDELLVDQLVFIEAMRACAAEEDATLVDHWSSWHWQPEETVSEQQEQTLDEMVTRFLKTCSHEPSEVTL